MTAKKVYQQPDIKKLVEKVKMLSPFELKDEFIKMAKKSRELGTQSTWCEGDLAGMPQKEGSYERFLAYLAKHNDEYGMDLLKQVVEYGIEVHNFDPDEWADRQWSEVTSAR